MEIVFDVFWWEVGRKLKLFVGVSLSKWNFKINCE